MAGRNMRKCLNLTHHDEMQIKITRIFPITPFRIAVIENDKYNKCGEENAQTLLMKMKIITPMQENCVEVPKTIVETEISYDPAKLLGHMHPKKMDSDIKETSAF